MKAFLLAGLLTLCCFVTVEGLQCNVCGFKFPFLGCLNGKNNCNTGNSCQTIKASLGDLYFLKMNCSDPTLTQCNSTQTADSIFGFTYTTTCCNTDLCNSASILQLSLPAGLFTMIILLLKLY
ncbi:lymphocyte antigen 6 complex locus protein G6c [Rhinatrema bivittatum]|uniref:lymphocyte antigen 6 complex locus protein G6c n=1 Tax=Rhinatrema bivittatum TaxID=194408 RepID=UPI00112C3711|nr:lymphocyte antigen 6 complex locus protein G6c [Rhinatrema bivittatum]